MTKTNVEYAQENITIYPAPCPFKCKYCWSQSGIWRYRTRNPRPLEEAKRLTRIKKPKTVVVSFTTDPYQPRELNEHQALQTLRILSGTKHEIMILTKSNIVEVDFPFFMKWIRDEGMNLWIGMTLTSVMPLEDEPLATPNPQRIETLKHAWNLNLHTWASIEPWLPDKTYPRQIIEATHEFVDWYVIGRLNYETRYGYPKIPEGYYTNELKWIRALFDELGFSPSSKPCKRGYHIKSELRDNP